MDITILAALNSITEYQAAPTEKMIAHCTQVLYYVSWDPQSAIIYKSIDVQPWVHGDAAYLVAAKALSRIAT